MTKQNTDTQTTDRDVQSETNVDIISEAELYRRYGYILNRLYSA